MKNIILSVVFLLGWYSSKAQNLVKNPSFENYVQCPVGAGVFNGYIQNWYGFNPSSPSFFHSCAPLPNSVPQNSYGFQNANSGNGYATILVYGWSWDPDKRNYIEGIFSSLLKEDTVYCVSYYVSVCDIGALGAIKNIDAHISDTLIDWNNGAGFILINIVVR